MGAAPEHTLWSWKGESGGSVVNYEWNCFGRFRGALGGTVTPRNGEGLLCWFPSTSVPFAGSGLIVETWGSQAFHCLLGKGQVSGSSGDRLMRWPGRGGVSS